MDKKYDTGKPMVGLMKQDFHLALIAVAEVTSYGVKKYNQPGSWRTVENATRRYVDALGRHDLQGTHELCCPESGLTHLAHRAWNALATLQLMLEEREEGRKDVEDVASNGTSAYEIVENPEWSGNGFGDGDGYCPICLNAKSRGHASLCKIGRLLK